MIKLKKPYLFIPIIIVLIVIGVYFFRYSQKTSYNFTVAKRETVLQQVSVTGNVKPVESIDLSFEKSGKINFIGVEVGDKVSRGQILIQIDNSELKSQLEQAKASRDVQKAKLDELNKGTRPEELQIAQTNVTNAQKTLADAQVNLDNVRRNFEANLQQVYDASLSAAAKSVAVATNSLYILTDIQYAHFMTNDQSSIVLAEAKANAVATLLGGINAGYLTSNSISQLNGGANATVKKTQGNPTYINIDQALSEVADSLTKVKLALEVVPMTTDLTSTEKTNLSTEKNNINNEIITINGKQQSIEVQKTTNDYNIKTAEINVTNAQNALAAAQDQLILERAGSTPEQITAQEAQLEEAEAQIQLIQTQIDKTILRSPMGGIITKQDAKLGEIIPMATPIISIISTGNFEIETNVPEVDIAKIKIGDSADITLDAYGTDVVFQATVARIDPAEIVIEGVTTYKVTLQFVKEDERLKSGMTANIDITTAKSENTIAIPQRAVTSMDGDKTVKILEGKEIKEVKVKTGLKGSDGNIEILEGIKEGDKIITS